MRDTARVMICRFMPGRRLLAVLAIALSATADAAPGVPGSDELTALIAASDVQLAELRAGTTRGERRDANRLAAAIARLRAAAEATDLGGELSRAAVGAARLEPLVPDAPAIGEALDEFLTAVRDAVSRDIGGLTWQISQTAEPKPRKRLDAVRAQAEARFGKSTQRSPAPALRLLRRAWRGVHAAANKYPPPIEPGLYSASTDATGLASVLVRGRSVECDAADVETGEPVEGCTVRIISNGDEGIALATARDYEPKLVPIGPEDERVSLELVPLDVEGYVRGPIDSATVPASFGKLFAVGPAIEPRTTAARAAEEIQALIAAGDAPTFVIYAASTPGNDESHLTFIVVRSTKDAVAADLAATTAAIAPPNGTRFDFFRAVEESSDLPNIFLLSPTSTWTPPIVPQLGPLDLTIIDGTGAALSTEAAIQVLPVSRPASAKKASTDSDGIAHFEGIAAGDNLVRVSARGFRVRSVIVSVDSASKAPTWPLKEAPLPRAIALARVEPFVVSPSPILLSAGDASRALTMRARKPSGSVSWTVTAKPAWISLSAMSGVVTVGHPVTLTATLTQTGSYLSGTIEIDADGGHQAIQVFAVGPGDAAALQAERAAGVETVLLGDQNFFPQAFVVDGVDVFVTEFTNTLNAPSRIRRVPVGGGRPETLVTDLLPTGGRSFPNLVDHGLGFLILGDLGANLDGRMSVWRIPKYGGPRTELTSLVNLAPGLRTDGTDVFAVSGTSLVRFSAYSPGSATIIIPTIGLTGGLRGVEIDAQFAYAADRGGRILRVAKVGGTVATFVDVTGSGSPYHLLGDPTHLYWGDDSSILPGRGIHRGLKQPNVPTAIDDVDVSPGVSGSHFVGQDNEALYVVQGSEVRRYDKVSKARRAVFSQFVGFGGNARIDRGYLYWLNDVSLPTRIVRYSLAGAISTGAAVGSTLRQLRKDGKITFEHGQEVVAYYSAGSTLSIDVLGSEPPAGTDCTLRVTHCGIDIALPEGTPVYAAGAGVVERVTTEATGGALGNAVVIRHDVQLRGKPTFTAYLHLRDAPLVQFGDPVVQGTQIGYVGDTGAASAPHLHFEIRHFPELLNPNVADPNIYLFNSTGCGRTQTYSPTVLASDWEDPDEY